MPTLTHSEEGLYAQIAGSVPDAPPARVDRELDDDEVLDSIGAQVLSTPGHTDGSIALYFPNEAVLFTGDVATEHRGQVVLGPFNSDRPTAGPRVVPSLRRHRRRHRLLRPRSTAARR